ncbi:TRAP transporter small permease [Phycicoccus flavus]|uniref:TRAP transporter small permease n=1 Tax=Phycicoccus flavus TaxID=2502783 RepID=UPI000FEB9A1C|nr:TRAP transporter small permease subunit [Phycicoccus flavus]NHA68264.1 TRAP transporter small permease subunit [Phycicoccus flavus]
MGGSTPAAAGRSSHAARGIGVLDRTLALGAGAVAVLCLVVIGSTLLVSVVLRYVSGSSLPFATELPTYLFPWLVCAGIVAAAAVGGHLAVDYFVERMPTPAQRVVRVLGWTVIAVTLAYTAYQAQVLAGSYAGQRTPILGWPAMYSYLSYPLALVALALNALGRLLATVLGLPKPAGLFAEDDPGVEVAA